MLINPRHERFAQEIASGKSYARAYKDAGFAGDRANAWRLQQQEDIKQRVEELLAERIEVERKSTEKAVDALGVSKQWVVARLVENVERGLQARAVTDDDGKPIGEYKYDGGVVNRALELLGKEQGMFIDRKESGRPGDFAELQDADSVLALVRNELGDEMAEALKLLMQNGKSTDPEPTHDGSEAVN